MAQATLWRRRSAKRLLSAGYVIALGAIAACGSAGGSTTATTPSSSSQSTPVVPAPTASFSVAPTAPQAGQLVEFTNTSTGTATSWTWNFGDQATSTAQHPTHVFASAGTFTVSLTATSASGSTTRTQTVTVTAPGARFSMALTLTDQAQVTTIAFSGLAMMTGNLEAQSFFPPGKVADYTGFQYLRDNDPDDMGHNTSFLTRVANDVISILTDAQFAKLSALATSQTDAVNLYGYKRFPLMKAFRRQLDRDIPVGSTGLNLNAVKAASRELYLLDGQIAFDRAVTYSDVLNSFTPAQLAYLDAMKGKGWKSWPDVSDAQIQSRMRTLPQGTAVLVMTYAGDLFSWYAGSVDADVYFCPERQGTYYGGFYIKDAPAIGHEGYAIDEQLTATAGSALSDATKGYVTAAQATQMNSLLDTQRANLYASPTANIVKVRTTIATLLRTLRSSTTSRESVRTQVLALSSTYGDLDGENNYNNTRVFADIYATLTSAQKAKMLGLRHSIMSGRYADGTPFDFTLCLTAFLYSDPITSPSVLTPYIGNTDALFFEPRAAG